MSKHTPGLWQFYALLSGSENHNGFRVTNGSQKWWNIATVNPLDSDGVEGEANARLISAAPDLLAALQALMADNSALTFQDHLQLSANARAAIARATGGEQ